MATLEQRLTLLAGAVRDKINLMMPRLVPSGGAVNQVLAKTGAGDYAVGWQEPAAGPQGPAGVDGSDQWTYIRLATDFTTSSATAVDITGMGFLPAANTNYEFEALLRIRTATTTVGARPGLAWSTGLTDGVARISTPSSASAETIVLGNSSAALLGAVGGLPNTTSSYPAMVRGSLTSGASPAANTRLQLASETSGTVVTVKAGSFLKYRIIT